MAVAAVPQDLVDRLRSQFFKELEEKGTDSIHARDLERVKNDDKWLRRFLAHQEQDINGTLKMMWTSLSWRKEFQVNEITENTIRMDIIIKGAFFPHGVDIDGSPILIFKCKMHTKGSVDVDELKRCVVYWFERLERETNGDKISIFFDMEGCGLSHMDMDFIRYLIGLFKEYYPYFLNYIIIYEMPWVLSAAFKIVKTWLPEKAIERLKQVGKKDLHTFVNKGDILKCWGGENDYVFSFIPEDAEKTEKPVSDINIGSVKKVHFKEGSPMSGDQVISSSETKEEGPLVVNPTNTITFVRDGNELSSTLELHNTDPKIQVAFKLKTTSPEKFRVKPSTGYLKPGDKETIAVTLLSGYQLGGLSKDKFLVMSSLYDDKEGPILDLTELWKNTANRKVYQKRLSCVSSGEVSRNGNVILNHSTPLSDQDNQLANLLSTMKKINENQQAFHKSLTRLQYIQITQIVLFVVFGFGILYTLNSAISAISGENAYCRAPNVP